MRALTGWLLLLLSCTACDVADPPAEVERRRDDEWDEGPDCDAFPCAFGCRFARVAGHCGNPLPDCLAPPKAPLCEGSTDCGPTGTADCVERSCVPRCDEAACAQSCTVAEGCRCELGACQPIPCGSDAACPEGRCVEGRCGIPAVVAPAACSFVPARLSVSRGAAARASLVLEAADGALLDAPAELTFQVRGGLSFRDGRVVGRRVGPGAVIAALGEVRCELAVEVVAPPGPDETLLFVVDEQAGTPLEGALLRTPTHVARTDAAGVARLPGVGLESVAVTHLSGYEALVVGVALPSRARLPLRRRAPVERPSATFEAGKVGGLPWPAGGELEVAVAGLALAPTIDGFTPRALLGPSRRKEWFALGKGATVLRSSSVGANALDASVARLAIEALDCPGQRCTTPTLWSVEFPGLNVTTLRRPLPDLGPDWAFDLLWPGEGREVGLLLGTPVPDPSGAPSPMPLQVAASLQLHLHVPPLDVGGAKRWGAFVGALAELPGRGLVVRGLSAAIDPERDDDLSDGRLSDPAAVTCNGVPLRVGPRPAGAHGPWRLFAISAEPNPTRADCPVDRPCVDGLVLTRSEALHDGAVHALGDRFLDAPTARPDSVSSISYCAEDPDAALVVARWADDGDGTTWLLPPGCGSLELPDDAPPLAPGGRGAALTLQAVRLEGTPAELFDPDGPGLDHALRSARAITTTRVTSP